MTPVHPGPSGPRPPLPVSQEPGLGDYPSPLTPPSPSEALGGLFPTPPAPPHHLSSGRAGPHPHPSPSGAGAPGDAALGVGEDCIVTHAGQIRTLLGARRQLEKD